MSVSPADFALYSRVTGVPLPRTAAERMRIAPAVHSFVRNQEYADEPNLLQRTAGTIGKLALLGAAAGAGAYALNQYGKKSGDSPDDPPPPGGGGGITTLSTRYPSKPKARDTSGDIEFSSDPNTSVYSDDPWGPNISFSEQPPDLVQNQTAEGLANASTRQAVVDAETTNNAEVLPRTQKPPQNPIGAAVNDFTAQFPDSSPLGTEGTVTLESDYDAGNTRPYYRDEDDPRLDLPESPIDSRGRIALSRDPIGRARGQLEKFADDIRIEQYVPYTSVPLGAGVAWHQLSDAAAILGGQDAATLANPVARTVTELGNRAGGAFLRNDPTMGAIAKGVKATTEATTNTLDFLGNIGFRGHSVGDFVNWAATHAPAHEGVGNVLEAVGHMAHTMPLELGLGAAGIAGGTAILGAARGGWRARHNVDPKGESRLFPTKWERDARIDPYSVTYDRYLKDPIDKARQFASDFTVSLRPVDNSQLVGNEYQGNEHPDVPPGEVSQNPNQGSHSNIEQKEITETENTLRKYAGTIPPDQVPAIAKQVVENRRANKISQLKDRVAKAQFSVMRDPLLERFMGGDGGAFIEDGKVGESSAPLNVSPDKTSRAVDHITMYPTVSGERAGTMDWHLREWDKGERQNVGSKPYAYNVSDPLNLALQEMAEEGSLQKESFGKLFNTARKAKLITEMGLTE